MKPFFTIVIPTFNRSEEVQRSINCVLNQTYKNWELIVVDDGSSDSTNEVMRNICTEYKNIRYLHRPENRKKGANACRNIGIENANGEYIAMLDSDDEWKEQRLNSVSNFIKNVHLDGIFSGVMINDGKQFHQYKSHDIESNENPVDFLYSPDSCIQTSGLIFKSTAAINVLFDEDLLRHQDMDFFVRFGHKYKWKYFENYDVIVNWEKDRVVSKPHFPSMIAYYNKFKEQITNKRVISGYLLHCWINAKKNDPQFCPIYRDFLREIFAHLTFKQKLFAIAPNLSFYIWDKVLNTEGHWRPNN